MCRGLNLKRQKHLHDSFHDEIQVGTSQGSVFTLADLNLTKRSSVKVCDTFRVNTLLVSPDRKYIIAGTKDNDDLSPKVFFVLFDYLIFFCCVSCCGMSLEVTFLRNSEERFIINRPNLTYCTTVA